MTASDVVVELRPPPAASVSNGVVLVADAVLILFALSSDFPAWLAVPLVGLASASIGLVVAAARCRVRTCADGSLEVRNRFSTRRLHRADVDRVTSGWTMGWGSRRRLVLQLRDGTTLPLAATEVLPFRGQRRWLGAQAAELTYWLRDGRRDPS